MRFELQRINNAAHSDDFSFKRSVAFHEVCVHRRDVAAARRTVDTATKPTGAQATVGLRGDNGSGFDNDLANHSATLRSPPSMLAFSRGQGLDTCIGEFDVVSGIRMRPSTGNLGGCCCWARIRLVV